jgi:hypothetical protein
LGVSNNFNKGLRIANAKYVMLVGHDDLMTGCMNSVINGIQVPDRSIFAILSPVKTVHFAGKNALSLSALAKSSLTPKKIGVISRKRFLVSLLIGNWVFNPAIIWHMDGLENEYYDDRYEFCMDWDLLLRLAYKGKTCMYSETEIFTYRRHIESISMKNMKGRYKEELEVLSRNYTLADGTNILYYSLSKVAIMPRLNYIIRKLQAVRTPSFK